MEAARWAASSGKYGEWKPDSGPHGGCDFRTNNGSASREGTFVGTREQCPLYLWNRARQPRFVPLYQHLSQGKKQVFGSTIDGDNRFTEDAHIGYWSDLERKYKTVSGQIEYDCGERFFYEELEDGVRYIVTQKLGRGIYHGRLQKDLPLPWTILRRALWANPQEDIWCHSAY